MSKMPTAGRDMINLNMEYARAASTEESAERALSVAVAMLSYAMACGHLTAAEFSNEQVLVDLVRAQRRNALESAKLEASRAAKCARS